MMKRKKSNQKGFTYVEWITIILIVAVIVLLGLTIYFSLLERTREGADITAIHASYKQLAYDAICGEIPVDPETKQYDYSKYSVKLKQTRRGWQKKFNLPSNLIQAEGSLIPKSPGVDTCEFYFDDGRNLLVMSLLLPKQNTR